MFPYYCFLTTVQTINNFHEVRTTADQECLPAVNGTIALLLADPLSSLLSPHPSLTAALHVLCWLLLLLLLLLLLHTTAVHARSTPSGLAER